MTMKLSALALTAGLAVVGAAPLAPTVALAGPSVHIACPLPQIRREVTTPLPGGWWNTPIINSLTDTEVTVIGGKPTLVCRYGPAGQIMHLAPVGMVCNTAPGGFNCTSPFIPIPLPPAVAIHSQGVISIPQTYIVDLDTGSLNPGAPGDLWFEATNPTTRFINPVHGARMNVGGFAARGFAGCSAVATYANKVNLAALPMGTHICVRTNQGRVGEVQLTGLTGGAVKTLTMMYKTWN